METDEHLKHELSQDIGSGELSCDVQARSKAEFVARMVIVVEEADETVFWLELLVETGIVLRLR